MIKQNWKEWVKAAGIRAVRTAAQSAVAAIGTSAVMADVHWMAVVSTATLAGVLSLLTSITGLPECKKAEAGNNDKEN